MPSFIRFLLTLAVALLAATPARAQDADAETPAAEDAAIVRLELRDVKVVDAVRLIAELSSLNVVATEAAGSKRVTLYLQRVGAKDALKTLCRVGGLWFREDAETNTIRILTTDEYQRDLVVFREERTKVFTLLHPNAVSVATAIEDLYGDRVFLSLGFTEDDLLGVGPGIGEGFAPGGATGTGFGGGGGGLGAGGFRGGRGASGLGGARQFGTGSGRFSRRVVPTDDLFDGTGGTSRGILDGGRGTGSGGATSDRLIDERLTSDQIAELERRRAAAGEGGSTTLTSDTLRGLTREEPPIHVTVNRDHNLVIVRTSDLAAMGEIERLIVDVDRPTPQVLLEMKILELSLGDDFRSIFDLDLASLESETGPPTAQPPNPLLPSAATGVSNILGAGNFPLEGGTLIYQFLSDRVRARVQLLDQESKVSVLATPLVLCANNRASRIFVGEERPLVRNFTVQTNVTEGVVNERVIPQVEVRDIGNSLTIVPRINADRTVTLTILQDSSTVTIGGAKIPVPVSSGAPTEIAVDTVNTSNLEGTVVAKDGLTLAVGGLIRQEVVREEEKVPVLGDIPFLGFFFRKTVTGRAKREIVLLITPHVLMTPAEGQAASRARMKAMSLHPYHDRGDGAYNAFDKHDVPEPDKAHHWVKEFLKPVPEDGE